MRNRMIVLLMAILVLAVMTGGCTKGGGDETDGTASAKAAASLSVASASKKTATAAKTAAADTQRKTTGAATDGAALVTEGSGQTGGDGTTETAAENTDWAEDVVPDTVVEIAGKDIDLGGKTILVGGWSANYVPVDTPETAPHYVIWARKLKQAEEKYNCKFEFYTEPGYSSTKMLNNLLTSAVSGTKYVDICRTAASFKFPTLIKSNAILPLDDYIDFEAPIIKNNKYLYNGSYWNGRHYGVTHEFRDACTFFMYNKSIIDREGQPDILDLVEKNDWNWTTFLEIAKNCTKDTDGDGIIDQYGVTSTTNWYLCKYLLYSNGLTSGIEINDNGIQIIVDTPAAVRTFQFVSDLAFVHKVVKLSTKVDGINVVGVYPQGQAAMFIYNYGGPNRDLLKSGMKTMLAPMPMGPDASNYANCNTSQFYVLSIACDKPAESIKVFTEASILWTEDMQYIPEVEQLKSQYYPAGWDWNPSNPSRFISTEKEYRLVYEEMYKYYKPDFTDGFPNYSSRMNTLIATPIVTGTMSVMQAIDSALGELQSIVDSVK